jgi:hypothetical protein
MFELYQYATAVFQFAVEKAEIYAGQFLVHYYSTAPQTYTTATPYYFKNNTP